MKRPLSLRSSGSIEMPAAIESAGLCGAQRLALDENAAGLDWSRPENRLADFCAPGAKQSSKADDLAVADGE